MPTLLLSESSFVRAVPLAAATLVGRGAACLARVSTAACPAHWLELRWVSDRWLWRALAAQDRTYGGGAFSADGWRTLDARAGARVRLTGADVHVELVDDGPPLPFAWDMLADEPVDGDALTEVAEVRGDQLLPLDAEGDPACALRDGQCWVHVGADGSTRMLRAYVPVGFPPTLSPRMDLARPRAIVDIDGGELCASFVQDDVVAVVRGECVRVLLVFALARLHGEGWLDASAAWASWADLGGARETSLERMSWERGKLRAQLARQRVSGLDTLFARRKVGAFVELRLNLGPAAIFLRS